MNNMKRHLKVSGCESFDFCQLQSANIGNAREYFRVQDANQAENGDSGEESSRDAVIFNSSQILRSDIHPEEA